MARLKGSCDKVQGCVLAVSDQQHSTGQGQLSSSTVLSKLVKGAWPEYKPAMAVLTASLTSSPNRTPLQKHKLSLYMLIDVYTCRWFQFIYLGGVPVSLHSTKQVMTVLPIAPKGNTGPLPLHEFPMAVWSNRCTEQLRTSHLPWLRKHSLSVETTLDYRAALENATRFLGMMLPPSKKAAAQNKGYTELPLLPSIFYWDLFFLQLPPSSYIFAFHLQGRNVHVDVMDSVRKGT